MDDALHLIPQAPPFVMISKLLYADEHMATTSFYIDKNNILVDGDEFSEAGLIENIAQTAAARAGYIAKSENKPISVGYIGAVKGLEVYFLPKINDELLTEIRLENQIFDVSVISGKIWCKDELVAKCEMKVFANNQDS